MKNNLFFKYGIAFMLAFMALFVYQGATLAGITGKISGVIKDVATDEPLPGVNVIIEGTTLGAATDVDGYYFIINIPPGTYSLQASMIGYVVITKNGVLVSVDRTTPVGFSLKETAIVGEEVIVTAERPIIERDLTASQVVITAEQLAQSWISDINEAMSQETGILVTDGLMSARGGAFVDMDYILDGSSMNSGVVGDNYTGINKTSVQELRVLTGAFNAEYGSALSGIVDVVTRENTGRLSGKIEVKYRPSGIYHWGRYLYSHDLWDWTNFGLDYWEENDGGRPDLTPQERLEVWQNFVGNPDPIMRDYNKRSEWQMEGTLSGGITKKLSFMLSLRYAPRVNIYPQARKYNPEWNNQLKLIYRFSPELKLIFSGLLGGYKNAGTSKTFTHSTEIGRNFIGNRGTSCQITDPYEFNKYFPFSRPFNGDQELLDISNYSLKLVHTLSPRSFYEIQIGRLYEDLRQRQDNSRFLAEYPIMVEGENWYWADHFRNNYLLDVKQFTYLEGNPGEYLNSKTAVNSLKADFTSQVHKNHLLKTGIHFKHYDLDFESINTLYRRGKNAHLNLLMDGNPIEFVAYLQDKIELMGMVINAGLRFDYFNPRGERAINVWDPFAVMIGTEGHDPNDPEGIFSGWDNVPFRKIPARFRFSPRFGISHPITETTILHFSYGHFNMRPSWIKYLGQPYRWVKGMDDEPTPHSTPLIKSTGNSGMTPNPLLDFEKLIAYEVGFDQNIADLLRIDATLYYKQSKHLSTRGLTMATGSLTEDIIRTNAVTEFRSNSPNKGNPVRMYSNVVHRDARGLEITIETRFIKNITFRGSYDFSQNLAGMMGWYRVYEPAMNEVDGMYSGVDAEQEWLPSHKFKVNALFSSPLKFGPALGNFYPLGNSYLNVFLEARPGAPYTYHFPEDLSTEVNNRRWKAYYNINLLVNKVFNTKGIKPEIGIEVRNLFNYKMLDRPSGDNLEAYLRTNELWTHVVSGEQDEWGWYSNQPRQVYIRFGVTF